jgi:hypothetical protein
LPSDGPIHGDGKDGEEHFKVSEIFVGAIHMTKRERLKYLLLRSDTGDLAWPHHDRGDIILDTKIRDWVSSSCQLLFLALHCLTHDDVWGGSLLDHNSRRLRRPLSALSQVLIPIFIIMMFFTMLREYAGRLMNATSSPDIKVFQQTQVCMNACMHACMHARACMCA